jgi:hypothetical protein
MRLAVEQRGRPQGSQRPCRARQTDSCRGPQTSAHPGRRWGGWGGARRLSVWHVSSCPLRRVGMPTPVPPWRHPRPVGSWVGRRAGDLPPKPCCRGPGRAGSGPGGGVAQNLHEVGPAVVGFPGENAHRWHMCHLCSDIPGQPRRREGRLCTH